MNDIELRSREAIEIMLDVARVCEVGLGDLFGKHGNAQQQIAKRTATIRLISETPLTHKQVAELLKVTDHCIKMRWEYHRGLDENVTIDKIPYQAAIHERSFSISEAYLRSETHAKKEDEFIERCKKYGWRNRSDLSREELAA